jgi:mRNA interferase MazF
VRGCEQAELRPVLVLSYEVFNSRSETVIVMAITSQRQRAGFPLTLTPETEALPKESWLKISQIRTISTDRLGKRMCMLPPDALGQAVTGLLELIG